MKTTNASKCTAKSITNRQLFFVLFLTLSTSTTIEIAQGMAQTAGRSSWIPIMAGSLVFGIAVVIIAKLNGMYRGQVFFDYSRNIAGKYFPYLMGVYYFLYFIIVGIALKIKFVNVVTSNFLPKTPQSEMLFFSILLFAFVAYKGITNIARMFEIYGIMFLVITIMICVIMMAQGMKDNVLPLYNPNEAKNFLNSLKKLIMPFGGIEILLIIPFTSINKKAPKIAFLSLVFIGLFYVLIVESTIMIMGVNNTIAFNDPFIEAIKIADAPVIERLDIFYLTFGLTSLFAGMIIVFTATAEFACKLLPRVKRAGIVVVISAILYILTLIALGIKDVSDILDAFLPYLIITSAIIIPSTMFLAAKVKRRAAHSKENRYAS